MSFSKKVGDYRIVAPSRRHNKKYDVYDKSNNYVTSFGDIRYQHYNDKIGYYSNLNHNDSARRQRYRDRHMSDNITNPNYAGYWAYNYLW